MIPESVKQPGWYPDPDVPNQWRYWTGQDWSAERSEAPQDDGFARVVSAPLTGAMIAPPFQNTPVARPGTFSRETKKMFLIATACILGFFFLLPLAFVTGIKLVGILLF